MTFFHAQGIRGIRAEIQTTRVPYDYHTLALRLALDTGARAAAGRHAGIAKECAWCVGPPHCYKPALEEAERLIGDIGQAAQK